MFGPDEVSLYDQFAVVTTAIGVMAPPGRGERRQAMGSTLCLVAIAVSKGQGSPRGWGRVVPAADPHGRYREQAEDGVAVGCDAQERRRHLRKRASGGVR